MRSASLLCALCCLLLSSSVWAQEVIDLNLEGQSTGKTSIVIEEGKKPDAAVIDAAPGKTSEDSGALEEEPVKAHPCTGAFPASAFEDLELVPNSAKFKPSKKGASCKLAMRGQGEPAEVMAALASRLESEGFELKPSKKGDALKATRSNDARADSLEIKASGKGKATTLSVSWNGAVYSRPSERVGAR